ncbi:MAG: Gfo/Idh/MocA family oxidoreductase [Balneolaceae bacterium]|nr:Gfo/Idh/MocA family oxidoreductase [Balneolaceae bacterium]
MDRKTFIKTGSLATAGTILGAPYVLRANKKVDNTIRIGFIGTGLRGRNHVSNILDYEGVECPVICDIDPEAVKQTQKIFEEKGLESPKVYSEHERSYEEMLEKEDLDGVIMATDWKWHTPICIKAMEEGIYVGSEVSGAFSVEECWELVNTHQENGYSPYVP